jgi:hypothetical protein
MAELVPLAPLTWRWAGSVRRELWRKTRDAMRPGRAIEPPRRPE